MTQFEVECLQELLHSLQRAEMALVAYLGYAKGMEDGKRNNPSKPPLLPQERPNTTCINKLTKEEKNGFKAEITEQSETITITFTKKELSLMPLQFRKEYRIDGTLIRCRKRPTGQNKFTYEMRLRRDGYNVTATAKNLEECKAKFLAKLKEADNQIKTQETQTNFKTFAVYFFETFKKRKVAEATYKADCSRLNSCILPRFGDKDLKEIKPNDCQTFIDSLISQGKGKTAESVHSLLNQLFKGAIKHGYITHNPLDLIVRHKHEREHGTALTLEKEAQFLTLLKGDKYAPIFITALYTGMRPNEYAHAEFKGDFVITINSKRKNGKIEYKKIPLHPMLAPFVTPTFIQDFNALKKTETNTLRRYFCRNFANIASKLYDLRTTFYTRCEMCGINEKAKNHFVGHSNGILADTYTDLPDVFLIAEGQKLRYNL